MFLLIGFMCKAQVVYPLNTFYDDIPKGSYIKDINNDLDSFIGLWKVNYDQKEILISVKKIIKKNIVIANNNFYADILQLTYTIKDINTGKILQENMASNLGKYYSESFYYNPNTKIVYLSYDGSDCGVGWGQIDLKLLNETNLLWSYVANSSILTNKNCPDNSNIKIYLPVTKNLVFVRQ